MVKSRFTNENEFLYYVANILERAGFTRKINPAINGLRPDLIVTSPNGHAIILELKMNENRSFDPRSALRQALVYQKAIHADGAYVVVPSIAQRSPAGIISASDLVRTLQNVFKELASKPKRTILKISDTTKRVFCAMPFKSTYDDTFSVAMRYAAKRNNATAERVIDREFSGEVNAKIKEMIKSSVALIADLSESNPNVLYELGYCESLGIPNVLICSTPLKKLPFDVRNLNTIPYRIGQTDLLKLPLARRLSSALSS